MFLKNHIIKFECYLYTNQQKNWLISFKYLKLAF